MYEPHHPFRKASPPYPPVNGRHGQHPPPPPSSSNNTTSTSIGASEHAKDARDLHAWSLYRQNLNANFSEFTLSEASNGAGTGTGPFSHSGVTNAHKSGAGHKVDHPQHHRALHNRQSQSPAVDQYNRSNRTGSNNNIGADSAFPLGQSTVNNILNHPKYGAQMKNQDAFTYLRFGLPRVKVSSSAINVDPARTDRAASVANPVHAIQDHQAPNRAANVFKANQVQNSHKLNEELKQRFWNSDQNLCPYPDTSDDNSTDNPDCSSNEDHHQHRRKAPLTNHKNMSRTPHTAYKAPSQPEQFNGQYQRAEHVLAHAKGQAPQPPGLNGGDRGKSHSKSSSDNDGHFESNRASPYIMDNVDEDVRLDDVMSHSRGMAKHYSPPSHTIAKHPHLVVKDLLYEVDKSRFWRRMCGMSRQKLRVLEDISFDVRSGELLAIMATSGKFAQNVG